MARSIIQAFFKLKLIMFSNSLLLLFEVIPNFVSAPYSFCVYLLI